MYFLFIFNLPKVKITLLTYKSMNITNAQALKLCQDRTVPLPSKQPSSYSKRPSPYPVPEMIYILAAFPKCHINGII